MSFGPPPMTCLDDLLAGNTMKMADLQYLFGRDRKLFPHRLPAVRRGREILYDYQALSVCFDAFLSDRNAARRWPRDPAIRPGLVATLIAYVKDRASPGIKRVVLASLKRHRIRGAQSFFTARCWTELAKEFGRRGMGDCASLS